MIVVRHMSPLCVLMLMLVLGPVADAAKASSTDHYTNLDSRPLTKIEVKTFAALACPAGINQGPTGEPISCQALARRRITSNPYTGTTFNMAFQSIMYGHFTDATSKQAFIQYDSRSEGNIANFGGGILFQLEQNGWQLIRWYPALTFDNCLQLNPEGRAKMLCGVEYAGAEVVSRILVLTIPIKPITSFSDDALGILAGIDDRQRGDDANEACPFVDDGKHATLIVVGDPERSGKQGIFASADVFFIKHSSLIAFCSKNEFAKAPLTHGIVNLDWDGTKITIQSSNTFIPLDYSPGY